MPHPQFPLRALLVAMLVVTTVFEGIHFEHERQSRSQGRLFMRVLVGGDNRGKESLVGGTAIELISPIGVA